VTVEEKALELVAENRVIVMPENQSAAVAIVAGHHAHYEVMAFDSSVYCSCPAKVELCAHALAAMVVWAERETHEAQKPW
jgi:hypothetical protein